jgi:hypothetical protein
MKISIKKLESRHLFEDVLMLKCNELNVLGTLQAYRLIVYFPAIGRVYAENRMNSILSEARADLSENDAPDALAKRIVVSREDFIEKYSDLHLPKKPESPKTRLDIPISSKRINALIGSFKFCPESSLSSCADMSPCETDSQASKFYSDKRRVRYFTKRIKSVI